MSRALDFDFSGVAVRLAVGDGTLASALADAWSDYPGAPGPVDLDLTVDVGEEALPPGRRMRPEGESVLRDCEATFSYAEGVVRVHGDGTGALRVGRGEIDHQTWAVVNLVLAALGWRLPAIGGAALHAAAIAIDGRGFLLVGPAGAGKTTWARLAESAGARVVSDDVVVVRERDGRFEVLATPFRTQTFRARGHGRWPLAALLIPRHASRTALEPASRLVVEATVTANLLYRAGAPPTDRTPGLVVSRLLDSVPARTLAFALDGDFIELLRRFA